MKDSSGGDNLAIDGIEVSRALSLKSSETIIAMAQITLRKQAEKSSFEPKDEFIEAFEKEFA
jgi:hypothetical protein